VPPPHSTSLITTLVAALVIAFILGFLAGRLRLPPLVGYLVAGIAMGPATPGFVADLNLAQQLAEIGVILLMFGVGLHFSVADLLAVRTLALPGALVQMAVATPLGMGLALLWGWSALSGLILGLALSVASTVVLLRVLEERHALDTGEGRLAVGWLIVQDLAMVLALVLLPALARPEETAGSLVIDLVLTIAKIALFALLAVVVGRRTVPWLLGFVARQGSREQFTLAVLATALGIAYGSAELFGVSFALGAFFAGVVLSESDLSHQAAADSLPLRDAFAVLFFVSVGMLFDPVILIEQPFRILAVLVVILLAKSVAAVAIVLAGGQSLESALRVAAGLAQIGEFSFILGALGVRLHALPPEGFDLILAGALLSITLNPFAFDAAGRFARMVEARPVLLGHLERARRAVGPRHPINVEPTWQDHAIIVGHGRVGATIARALAQLELPYTVIEHDRRIAEELRGRGVPVIWGDAAAPGVLEAAGLRHARLLILAAPDGYQAGRVVARARQICPGLDAVARVHSEAEIAYLDRQGVGLALMGERELAFGMLDYALRSLGLREAEARLMLQAYRTLGDVRARPEEDGRPARGAPELRPHREDEAAERSARGTDA
jgi:monovalent cation:H+ antiporter-2, CPA2 family